MQNVAPGGIYVVEDIHSACKGWHANTGAKDAGLTVEGTADCLTTTTGGQCILAYLLDGQKKLAMDIEAFPGVNHIDICMRAAVLQKEIVVFFTQQTRHNKLKKRFNLIQ